LTWPEVKETKHEWSDDWFYRGDRWNNFKDWEGHPWIEVKAEWYRWLALNPSPVAKDCMVDTDQYDDPYQYSWMWPFLNSPTENQVDNGPAVY